ncbi:cupin domain-containing protein [Neobittarella massiliensis]|uniref:Cupin domain-containing protein n=1 Tax=Neobittarella massiliensis (ex Bilen et al. 2018) TaxID=2041842 RepID=A0A8J6IQP8_9FIRM|nr:cupin domain-containing protein [Neobittarella massiliensis]MBC3516383.1 cupin domain-containing protein [Neobittarella massiliensis]
MPNHHEDVFFTNIRCNCHQDEENLEDCPDRHCDCYEEFPVERPEPEEPGCGCGGRPDHDHHHRPDGGCGGRPEPEPEEPGRGCGGRPDHDHHHRPDGSCGGRPEPEPEEPGCGGRPDHDHHHRPDGGCGGRPEPEPEKPGCGCGGRPDHDHHHRPDGGCGGRPEPEPEEPGCGCGGRPEPDPDPDECPDIHCDTDHGPGPYVANIETAAQKNCDFRTAYWTGEYLQMTLMSIPVRGDIGLEMHPDTDQFIRVEEGMATVKMGSCRTHMTYRKQLYSGYGVFVPAGTWHNIVNTGRRPLKLSSVYAPVHHPRCTVHPTKKDAQ